MAKTKGDLVLKALRKAGLYSNATLTDADPQAIEDAINDLEDMMAAWQAKGIELGYQFADTENGIMPLPLCQLAGDTHQLFHRLARKGLSVCLLDDKHHPKLLAHQAPD